MSLRDKSPKGTAENSPVFQRRAEWCCDGAVLLLCDGKVRLALSSLTGPPASSP
ncbi:hypothetical protein [Candidatus Electrothrix sp.]|uniref:hypothetical protein n=1 Tax=Candidatus Electrothrix sp. TaxID=2170559 RepID=UPI0040575CB1